MQTIWVSSWWTSELITRKNGAIGQALNSFLFPYLILIPYLRPHLANAYILSNGEYDAIKQNCNDTLYSVKEVNSWKWLLITHPSVSWVFTYRYWISEHPFEEFGNEQANPTSKPNQDIFSVRPIPKRNVPETFKWHHTWWTCSIRWTWKIKKNIGKRKS